jgi:Fe-S oxidoreductase
MAKIKFEFLARFQEKHGTPLRSRMMADIARASRLSSGPQAALINWLMRNSMFKSLLERFVGISAKRSLPQFATKSFRSWYRKRGSKPGPRGKVVLFNDTFNTYNYPEVSIAAVEVLESCGFEVVLPGHRCCGRPMISKGLVEQARAAARQTVEKLAPFAEAGIPIVGLEPSCLLTLRDEFLYLLPEDSRPSKIAACAFTFEEFIAKLEKDGVLPKPLRKAGAKALLHGHCHQKALSSTKASHATLVAAGFQVEEIDSGCCGMAGSFGYESEHYEISLQMGERALLPAVRRAEPGTVLVAAGLSCREQIKHGTGVQALHPAQVLRSALLE